jgi:hypothetical protein
MNSFNPKPGLWKIRNSESFFIHAHYRVIIIKTGKAKKES